MNTRQTRDLPAPLEGVRQRFVQWRTTHKARSRIPDTLWTAAVRMAGTYGLHRTARALRVEYYSLKKRVEQQSAADRERRESGPVATFMELPLPADHGFAAVPTGACDCALELEGTDGPKMRVHLKAAAARDLAALCRSFWNPAS
jgi:hypothetical protein